MQAAALMNIVILCIVVLREESQGEMYIRVRRYDPHHTCSVRTRRRIATAGRGVVLRCYCDKNA